MSEQHDFIACTRIGCTLSHKGEHCDLEWCGAPRNHPSHTCYAPDTVDGKLPLNCVKCRKPNGPMADVGEDHAGYMCDECYTELQSDEDGEELEEEEDEEYESEYMKDPKAKTVEGFIEGLTILAKYMKEGIRTAHFTGSGYDVLWIHTETDADYEVHPYKKSEDGLKLNRLGFHIDPDGESWAYFT